MSAVLLQGDLSIQSNDQHHNPFQGLALYKENKEATRLGRFHVQYNLIRVLSLASIRKYLLMNSRWRVYVDPVSKELSTLFKKIFQCHPLLPSGDTRYAMVVKVREHSSIYLSTAKLDNPFIVGKETDGLLFPLPSTSHFLIYGEKQPESQSLSIYASLLHEPNEFINIFQHTISDSYSNLYGREDALKSLEKSMEKICQQSGLKRFSSLEHGVSKRAKSEKEWDYINTLDRIREQNSKTVVERQIVKSKSAKQKKVTMIAVPTAVIGDKHVPFSAASSKENSGSLIESSKPTRAVENQNSSSSVRGGSAMAVTAPEIKDVSSTSISVTESLTSRRKDDPMEAENKKMLKKLVWDKLLQRGYVKRDENTKACYHQIYQSSQFILRNVINTSILPMHVLDSVVEKHFEFYANMDGFANITKSDQ